MEYIGIDHVLMTSSFEWPRNWLWHRSPLELPAMEAMQALMRAEIESAVAAAREAAAGAARAAEARAAAAAARAENAGKARRAAEELEAEIGTDLHAQLTAAERAQLHALTPQVEALEGELVTARAASSRRSPRAVSSACCARARLVASTMYGSMMGWPMATKDLTSFCFS